MPHHVVVDGSNIATEGRAQPSLRQLNDAVLAYMAEHPDTLVTVVVDATFGHRIDKKEVAEFDAAVANNELVAPPAGAVGRGDAFVLSIAHKAKAAILSNDSFQEFHGQYPWLFDEGRLVGGKPVPHVGWVFVARLPVRGPTSRKAMGEAKRRGSAKEGATAADATVRVGSPEASKPMPVPKAPPPGPAKAARKRAAAKLAAGQAAEPAAPAKQAAAKKFEPKKKAESTKAGATKTPTREAPAPGTPVAARNTVNALLPFLTFVEAHPVGTSVNAVVDHYSSHGAYVTVGDVVGYVPLRLMAEPAPRSARELMKIGESITLVVESFQPAKRSVDLAVPGMGSVPQVATPKRRVAATKTSATKTSTTKTSTTKASTTKAPAKKVASPKVTTAAATKIAGAAKKTAAKAGAEKRPAAAKRSAKPSNKTGADGAGAVKKAR
jgi:hypothetical protein